MRRFAAAKRYVDQQSGQLGVVMHDRQTGATWTAGTPDHPVWTASSIKLALALDLLEQDQAGSVALSATDKDQMGQMLNWSSNDAAMSLWNKYGDDAMVGRWRSRFGMAHVTFVDGFKRNWGYMKASTNDFAALVGYVLDKADPSIRSYVVNALQNVAGNQHWGVWDAGSDQQPGNKDGWSYEADNGAHNWITNTVGFAGPNQRYVIAIMYQLTPNGTMEQGVHAVSDVAALLFGKPTPAPVAMPDPDE